MSKRDPKLFVKDILEAIEKIERYTTSIENIDDFKQKDIVIDAVLRNLEIIGEAAKNIPSEIRERYSSIPWNRVIGLRNLVIHGYFTVDLSIIWTIVKKQLPPFKGIFLDILEELSKRDT